MKSPVPPSGKRSGIPPEKKGSVWPPEVLCEPLGTHGQSNGHTDHRQSRTSCSGREASSAQPEITAHLSETSPMPESSSLIFRSALAAVILVGPGAWGLRLQVIRRPLADRARSSVSPDNGHKWLAAARTFRSVCPRCQDKHWQSAKAVFRGGKEGPHGDLGDAAYWSVAHFKRPP